VDTTLTAFEKRVISALAGQATLAAALLEAWSRLPCDSPQTARSLTRVAQLGVTEERGAQEILAAAVGLGLTDKNSDGYSVRPTVAVSLRRLAFALRAISHYRASVHSDVTTARVVLTKPPRPSALENELTNLGWRTADLEATEHAFRAMVQEARARVVVMTPFFDERGARWLQELFDNVAVGVSAILVLRSLEDTMRPDYPTGYPSIAPWLKAKGVQVYNYSAPRLDGRGRETFHAKVVLCDSDRAYVGSTNLTTASLEHSMEMGVALTGKAAADVAVIIRAVLAVARPCE
jgi:phosphatidylserine/phosphatidylglycerophosphate/cardiolipin synthase-like enzyme